MIQQVEKLKEIINQNSMGHLPLPYRVDLMKQISDICIVQKVLCECCKKVCSCFTKEYDNENPLYSVLSEIDVIFTRIRALPKAYRFRWNGYAIMRNNPLRVAKIWQGRQSSL